MDPVPAESLFIDGGRSVRAVSIKAHARYTSLLLFWGEELDVRRRMRKEEEYSNAKNNGNGTLYEEYEGLSVVSRQKGGWTQKRTQPLYPPI